GEQRRDLQAALAALVELPRRGEQLGEGRARAGHRLAVEVLELRLVVEGVHVGRRPFHAQEDDVLGAGREVRRAGGQGVVLVLLLRGPGRGAGEGEVAEARGGALQSGAGRDAATGRVRRITS